SPGAAQSGNAALVYNSDWVNTSPIIQASVGTANNAALPANVTATMTWDGTSTGGTSTYSTAGGHPGDTLTVAVGGPFVTASGRHTWGVSVQVPGQGTYAFSGTAFVVNQDLSPFGGGWTFGVTDR